MLYREGARVRKTLTEWSRPILGLKLGKTSKLAKDNISATHINIVRILEAFSADLLKRLSTCSQISILRNDKKKSLDWKYRLNKKLKWAIVMQFQTDLYYILNPPLLSSPMVLQISCQIPPTWHFNSKIAIAWCHMIPRINYISKSPSCFAI